MYMKYVSIYVSQHYKHEMVGNFEFTDDGFNVISTLLECNVACPH
jgi:hypothetical protein